MPVELTVLPGGLESDRKISPGLRSPEKEVLHLRNVSGSVLQNALDTWGEIWDQLDGTVMHGTLVAPEIQTHFEPECGWPEFLEKMWLLKHYINYAKRFCEGKS